MTVLIDFNNVFAIVIIAMFVVSFYYTWIGAASAEKQVKIRNVYDSVY